MYVYTRDTHTLGDHEIRQMIQTSISSKDGQLLFFTPSRHIWWNCWFAILCRHNSYSYTKAYNQSDYSRLLQD